MEQELLMEEKVFIEKESKVEERQKNTDAMLPKRMLINFQILKNL